MQTPDLLVLQFSCRVLHLMSGFLLAGYLPLSTCQGFWGAVCRLFKAALHRLDSTPSVRSDMQGQLQIRVRRPNEAPLPRGRDCAPDEC